MYNEQLEKLIDLALVDGKLTEKELEVLRKKADALNIDSAEFDMVLDARLYQKGEDRQKQEQQLSSAPIASHSQQQGEAEYLVNFAKSIDAIELDRQEFESQVKLNEKKDKKPARNKMIKKVFLWWFFFYIIWIIKAVITLFNRRKPAKWDGFDMRKQECIMNLVVPPTNEAALEFINIAYNRMQAITYFNAIATKTRTTNAWNKIWLDKIEQLYNSAENRPGGDQDAMNRILITVGAARKLEKSNADKAMHLEILILAPYVIASIVVAIAEMF